MIGRISAMEKKITVIPATIPLPTKQRVAIYCRVSSASGAQLHSLAAQASYLTKYVMIRFGMQLEDIYLDVGSGSNAASREEFKRMMDDAKRGNFDLIITKSISLITISKPYYPFILTKIVIVCVILSCITNFTYVKRAANGIRPQRQLKA